MMPMTTHEDTPETASVEAFATFLLDDDRLSFTYAEACALAKALDCHESVVIRALRDDYGFAYAGRPVERRKRGFLTSSLDRWQTSPSHGGSGWEQITGFAGARG